MIDRTFIRRIAAIEICCFWVQPVYLSYMVSIENVNDNYKIEITIYYDRDCRCEYYRSSARICKYCSLLILQRK